jgi:GAF domain-containing protein
VEPIPESREVLRELSSDGSDLVASLTEQAEQVVELVPECVAVSISLRRQNITFTLVSTSDQLRILDAVQYFDDGPCEASVREDREVAVPDLLSEDRWQLVAQASAAHGVMSSLSLPIHRRGEVIGGVNFYGSTSNAFEGREHAVAAMFGARVEETVANADLSMASLDRARRAPEQLRANDRISQAAGMVAVREGISPAEAQERLLGAAERAGLSRDTMAKAVVALLAR